MKVRSLLLPTVRTDALWRSFRVQALYAVLLYGIARQEALPCSHAA